jgi:serine/threonine protein kinase
MHPDRIGPYLIDKRIGAGGMGNVYLGRHEQTGAIVAVKELPASLAREEGFVLRFNREIEAMRKLNCPNIVKFFDNGTDGELYYYAMEYVDGENLTTRLRREKRIPWLEAIEISRQICAGLKHAHDVGVVHRDLKPSNLMLGKVGIVKITDFGVAQIFAADRLTSTGGSIGTAEFMSPEQVIGSRVDKRSDLYSLGAVLYTMIVGQPPFIGPTASDIMQKQRFARFDPPKNYVPEIPPGLNDLICQLLEKEPEKRPPDAFVTSKRLQEVINRAKLLDSRDKSLPGDATRVDPDTEVDPISGTLVRDLLRLDGSASGNDQPPLLTHAFSNIWSILGAMCLIMACASWLFWQFNQPSDPAEQDFSEKTESNRIIQLARKQLRAGNPGAALEQLNALQSVMKGDPLQNDVLTSIERLRRSIDKSSKSPDQIPFVERALTRADELPVDRRDEARQIYEGIISLYDKDQHLETYVQTAKAKLEQESKDERK